MTVRRVGLLGCYVVALLVLGGSVLVLAPALATADESTTSSTVDEPTTTSSPEEVTPEVTLAETWCLEPDNGHHVASAANSFGSAAEEGENIKVGDEVLTIEQWSRQAKSDFEQACERAFELYGPGAGGDDDSSDIEEWLIPLLGAFGGTIVGAGAAHYSSALRDRKLWIREDTAMIRRLAIEVGSVSEEAKGYNAGSQEGRPLYARLTRVASDLGAILDDASLNGDAEATSARAEVKNLVEELGKAAPEINLNRIGELGSGASKTARDGAASWATKLHPKPKILRRGP